MPVFPSCLELQKLSLQLCLVMMGKTLNLHIMYNRKTILSTDFGMIYNFRQPLEIYSQWLTEHHCTEKDTAASESVH